MIRDSGPMKKLSNFTKHLKSKGYYIVGLQSSKISLKNVLVASIEAANRGGRKVKQVSDSNNLKVGDELILKVFSAFWLNLLTSLFHSFQGFRSQKL